MNPALKSLVLGGMSILSAWSTQAVLAQAAGTIEAGVLKVGSDLTYPPYNYFDGNQRPAGFDVELMSALGKAMNLEVQVLDTRFENLILGVRGSQFDVIASTLYVKPERAEQIDYIPYMKTGVSIAVATYSGQTFANPEELCGHVVGSIKGAAWLAELTKLNETVCGDKPIDSREFPTSPEVTQALLTGGVDAQIEDSAVLQNAVSRMDDRLTISTKENFYPVIVGLGVRKGNTELADTITAALATIKADGTYAELLARYNVSEPTDEEFRAAVGQ